MVGVMHLELSELKAALLRKAKGKGSKIPVPSAVGLGT
jgi:hypothetical protein